MKFGVLRPGGTGTQQLEQAILAEQSGWDGVFVWEAGYGVDARTLLAAVAARTERVQNEVVRSSMWPSTARRLQGIG